MKKRIAARQIEAVLNTTNSRDALEQYIDTLVATTTGAVAVNQPAWATKPLTIEDIDKVLKELNEKYPQGYNTDRRVLPDYTKLVYFDEVAEVSKEAFNSLKYLGIARHIV